MGEGGVGLHLLNLQVLLPGPKRKIENMVSRAGFRNRHLLGRLQVFFPGAGSKGHSFLHFRISIRNP